MHREQTDDHHQKAPLAFEAAARMLNATLADNVSHLVTMGTTEDDDIQAGVAIAGVTLGIVIIAIGAFGNVLVILAVVLCKPLYKSSNMFVVSLAVCDLFQTVMVKPLYVHTYVAGEWQFGAQVCLYALYASNFAILESILHVSAIAFYRYVIIVHPKAARCFQNIRAVVGLLLLIYILPLLIVLAPSIPRLTNNVSVLGRDVVFNTKIMFCSYVKHSDFRIGGVVKKVMFLTGAAIFLFYCYIRIYHSVRVSGRSITTNGGFSPCRMRREITLLKTVLAVFLSFVVAYLPISILYGADKYRTFPDVVYFFGVILLWMSSSINWMIYGLMNKQYRQAYRFILCGVRLPAGIVTENGSASKFSYNMSFRDSFDHRRSVCRGRMNSCRDFLGSVSEEDEVVIAAQKMMLKRNSDLSKTAV